MRSQRLELVGRAGEAELGELGHLGGERLGEAVGRVEAGADGGAALGELEYARLDPAQPLDPGLDLGGIAGKFLPQGQRGRVLEMGPADLDEAIPGRGLCRQPAVHGLERRDQPGLHRPRRGDVHRGREAVVRRLGLVDMVVGMDRALAAAIAGEDLVGSAGDHLVGVHVGLGAGARLPDDQGKLVVVHPARDFARRLLDRLGELGVEAADPGVHPSRRLLHEAQGMDDLDRHRLARPEREILDRALGLRSPISVAGDVDRPEAVGLGAGGGGGDHSQLRSP